MSHLLVPSAPWAIVIPVRGGGVGKSRLERIEERVLSAKQRQELTAAMAADTVAAAVGSVSDASTAQGSVWVLTADRATATLARALGARTRTDSGAGLNAELTSAAADLASTSAVALLLGDLPAVHPTDIRAALEEATTVLSADPHHVGAFVPDWLGTGTALLALPRGSCEPTLAFGPDSAAQHERLGYRPISHHLDRLRCDVDTPAAWQRVVTLGLGPRTARVRDAVLARHA